MAVTGDINPQILSTGDSLQDLAMQSICSFKRFPGAIHLYQLAFGGVELHLIWLIIQLSFAEIFQAAQRILRPNATGQYM